MTASWSALLSLAALICVQEPSQVTDAKVFKGSAGGTLPYRIYRPEGADSGKKFPLLLFLHGAGERGDDNAVQLKHGIKQFLARQEKNPCFIVVPQCPKNVWWSALRRGEMPQLQEKPTEPMALTLELVDALRKELPLDENRFYVTGLSMGGYGTWDLLCRRPDLFAAGVPVCGGGDPSKAPLISKVPQWIFHGDKDTAVPVDYSRAMVEALKRAGGQPKYTEYPGVGHNSWDKAYADPELHAWLFAQKR